MKPIRTLLLTSLAFLLSLNLAEALTMTVVVTTSSANSNVMSAQLTAHNYAGSVIPVNGGTAMAPGTLYPSNYTYNSGSITLTYNFTLPDNIRGQAVSIGGTLSGYVSNGSGGYTTTQTGYHTALFTAQASVSLPLDGFNKGPVNAPTGPQFLPPPQTGDMTIRNFATATDTHTDLYLQFDTYSGTNVTSSDTYGIGLDRISGGVPTLSQQYLGPGSRCRWSWSVGNSATTRQIMAIDSADNILSLYNPTSSAGSAIKLDPGTGAAGTAKITIDGQPVLTQLAASGLYLTQNAASQLYLTETSADGRYLRPTLSRGFRTPLSSATGESAVATGNGSFASAMGSTAMGQSQAHNAYATALGNSYAYGNSSTALGNSYAFGFHSTALGNSYAFGNNSTTAGSSVASGIYATALGGSNASGYYSTALGWASTASGSYSTATGNFTVAQGTSQFVAGQFNLPQTVDSSDWILTEELFTIGNGIDGGHRSNALVVKKNGETTINGSLTVVKKPDDAAVTGNLTTQGDAHVVGTATFDGPVRIAPQGDILMGEFGN